jgi:hypothetical protein
MCETLKDTNDGKCSYDLWEGTGVETDGCWEQFAGNSDATLIGQLCKLARKIERDLLEYHIPLERERDELRHQIRLMLGVNSKQPEELILIDRKIMDQVVTLLNELNPATWLGLPFIEGRLVTELKEALNKN